MPFARWNDAALVNTRGEVFSADVEGRLAAIRGAGGPGRGNVGAVPRVVGATGTARAGHTERCGCRRAAAGRSRRPARRGTLTVELGRDEPDARLARFVAAQPRTLGALARAGTRVDYVDLRYRNGFAARVPQFREKTGKPAA